MENKKIVCTNKDGVKYDVNADQLKFRPGVYGIIVRDNKILLSRVWDSYDFPGGGVNVGEKIESALAREVKEETGFDVAPKELISCLDDFHKNTFSDTFVHSILIYYTCEITGGELSKDNFDKNQFEDKYMELAEWVSLEEAAKIKFYDPAGDLKKQLLVKIKNGGRR